MSFGVSYTPEARAHLVGIYRYVAEAASPRTAQRFTLAIEGHCNALESFPYRGVSRDDLRLGVRTLSFRRVVTIVYSVEADQVSILGVFYGGQDFEAVLRDE